MKPFTFFIPIGLILLLQTGFITCNPEQNRWGLILDLILTPPSIVNVSSPWELRDGASLRQKVQNWGGELALGIPRQEDMEKCKDAPSQAKRLTSSIQRAVNFYEAHADQFSNLDATVGLQVLEGSLQNIFKKRGETLHQSLINRTIPLINQIMEQTIKSTKDSPGSEEIKVFGRERGLFSRAFDWKSCAVIKKRSSTIPDETVGHGLETVWGPLNHQCQGSLIRDCYVPYACKVTYLDPELQSQYMLTHQALYLLFANQKSCQLKHPEMFRETEAALESQCVKMLKEAEFLAMHGFPDWGRDLFSEYVFICGLAGYPNFLRSDWTQEIESWQSESDFGCFVNPREKKYFSNEVSFVRKSTEAERLVNVESMEECSIHFSSTSLSALALKLEYLHDNCLPDEAEEYERMMA